MVYHDPEVMSSNPSQVGVHSPVCQTWTQNINYCLYKCSWYYDIHIINMGLLASGIILIVECPAKLEHSYSVTF